MRIHVAPEDKSHGPYTGGMTQKLVSLTHDTWHTLWTGAGAIDATTNFTNPDQALADRIPELTLEVGGTPGTYILTGTWSGVVREIQITSVAAATVKANLPFDTITRFQGPGPGADKDLTLYHGDSYADPPCRAFDTGAAGGNVACQLENETAIKVIPNRPPQIDWLRRIVRVRWDDTTITDGYFVW